MQRGVAIFSFYHRNYSKPSTDHLTHGVLMASIHPAGDSYNHRPSDLHDVCHPTGNFILSSSCVVWLVVRSRGSREKDSEKVSTYAWWYSYLRDCLSLNSQEMKTASLGLLEVMVVRVNAGGDAPPDPPLLVTSRAHSPFLCFLQEKIFGE